MHAKRTIYISLFMFLGFIVAFLIHVAIETPIVKLLAQDFDRYSLGLSWSHWIIIHHIATALILFGGILFGHIYGGKWWRIIYVEKRYSNKDRKFSIE